MPKTGDAVLAAFIARSTPPSTASAPPATIASSPAPPT